MINDFHSRVASYVSEYTEAWNNGTDIDVIVLIQRDGYAIGFPSLYDGAIYPEVCFTTSVVQNSEFWEAICEGINCSLMDSEWGGLLRTVS